MRDRTGYVIGRILHGLGKCLAARELRRERCGQGAAGAVRVPRLDALRDNLREVAPVEEQVDQPRTVEVPPFDQDGPAARVA